MLGRKVIYVRCINCSYNNVAKGTRLLEKKPFFVYRGIIPCKYELLKDISPSLHKGPPLRNTIFAVLFKFTVIFVKTQNSEIMFNCFALLSVYRHNLRYHLRTLGRICVKPPW